MNGTFIPMGGTLWDRDVCTFPKLASTKLDGIRVNIGKDLLGKSLKPLRNIQLREHFKEIITLVDRHGIPLDGEIFSNEMPFEDILSLCNSADKPVPEHVFFNCFDAVSNDPFIHRYDYMCEILYKVDRAKVVPQRMVYTVEEVDALFEQRLAEGQEGLMLRDPNAPYKFGKSTLKEGWLLKVKSFETFDSQVLGVEERMENTNESQVNERGEKFKRNTKADKKPTGIAAKLLAEYEGKPVKVVLTGNEDFRREIWQNKEKYLGRWFEWKGMLVGAKDVPRHPNFIRWRDDK